MEINERIAATPDESEEIYVLTEKDSTLNQLSEALHQLNKEQHTCLTLFYLQKKSYTDIAGCTGFSMMQVKSHIQNGKRNLKLLLKNKYHYNS